MIYTAFSQIVSYYIFMINLWLRQDRYYLVITGEENHHTKKLIVDMLKVKWLGNDKFGDESPRVMNYSPMTAARGRSEEVVIIPGTVERSLFLNSALQTICNFILQSGSLITFSNHSSLQLTPKIELISVAIKIVKQFRLRLQDDHD